MGGEKFGVGKYTGQGHIKSVVPKLRHWRGGGCVEMKGLPMRMLQIFLSVSVLPFLSLAQEQPSALGANPPSPPKRGPVVVHRVQYEGRLSENNASFTARLNLECTNKVETVLPLFEGDLAVLNPAMPEGLRLDRVAGGYSLAVTKPGEYEVALRLLARIQKNDQQRAVEFKGPPATIAGLKAAVAGNGMELQVRGNAIAQPRPGQDKSAVSAVVGADRKVSLQWQAKVVRQEREALVNVNTACTVTATPAALKYATSYQFNILQGSLTNLVLQFPAGQVRDSHQSSTPVSDFQTVTENGITRLTLEFPQPVKKPFTLTLLTDQALQANAARASVFPPHPQGIDRERGQINLKAIDMKTERDPEDQSTTLTQVNAAADTVAAWRFFDRDYARDSGSLNLLLARIQPEISVRDTVSAVLKEKELLVTHRLELDVRKAGIYRATISRPDVTTWKIRSVSGDKTNVGNEDGEGPITLEFTSRVQGKKIITVVLEGKGVDLSREPEVSIDPLVVADPDRPQYTVRHTADISVLPEYGLEAKWQRAEGVDDGLRQKPAPYGLSFHAVKGGWKLTVRADRLDPHLVAEVSNGAVFTNNRVLGFAKIYYTVSDQDMKKFHVRVPTAWGKPEFLGTRKPKVITSTQVPGGNFTDYTLELQGQVRSEYTLQITYDMPRANQMTLHGALPLRDTNGTLGDNDARINDGGLVPLRRNTGTFILYSNANIQMAQPETTLEVADPDDPSDLDASERGRLNVPILYAYKYDENDDPAYSIGVRLKTYQEHNLQNTLADFTELYTVVHGTGQLATTMRLTVVQTDKENPRFRLPEGAEFVSAEIYPNDNPDSNATSVKVEDDEYVIPLPKSAGLGQSFDVTITYTEKHKAVKHDSFLQSLSVGSLSLRAPLLKGIPHTATSWTVYVPHTHELYNFTGNLAVEHETEPYTLETALALSARFFRSLPPGLVIVQIVAALVAFALLQVFLRRGWKMGLAYVGAGAGVVVLLGVLGVFFLGGMTMSRMTDESTAMPQFARGQEMHDSKESEGRPEDIGDKFDEDAEMEKSAEAPLIVVKPKPQRPPNEPGTTTPSQTIDPSSPSAGGLPGGQQPGGGGGGGMPSAGPGRNAPVGAGAASAGFEAASQRKVAGYRAPSVKIPKDGRAYVFTKPVNFESEGTNPRLAIRANIMDYKSHRIRQGIFHWLAILAGVLVLVWEYRREQRNSVWITAGLGLVLGGLGCYLLMLQQLHLVFINLPVVLGLAIFAWAVWYYWPLNAGTNPPPPPADDEADSDDDGKTDTPPAPAATAAAIALLLSLGTATAQAQEKPAPAGEALQRLQEFLRLLADPDLPLQKPGGPRVIRESHLQDRNGTWHEINQEIPFTGTAIGFYQDKQKRIESRYVNGKLHGLRDEWYDNGQKKSQSSYRAGLRHDKQSAWFRSGARQSETHYQAGKRDGLHRVWHPDGNLREETPHANGEPHGLARLWHANGKIARETRWENGRQLSFDTWTEKGVRVGGIESGITLTTADYHVTIHPGVAQVDATFKLAARASGQKFTLFREAVAVDDFTTSQPGARLLREGGSLVLFLPGEGAAEVKMKFFAKHNLTAKTAQRTLGFGIPAALLSHVEVQLPEDNTEVQMPTAVTLRTNSGAGQTTVHAIIGASDRLELAWKPRVKKASEIDTAVRVHGASVVSFGSGVVASRTLKNFQVRQGELRAVRLRLPPGWTLLPIKSGNVRNYYIEEGNLTVELDKPVTTSFPLELALEQTLTMPDAPIRLELPVALDVKGETGHVAVHAAEDIGLNITQSNGLTTVNVEDVARAMKGAVSTDAKSFAYQDTAFQLAARVHFIEAVREATARHMMFISAEKQVIETRVDYTIRKAGVYKLQLRLPGNADWRVTAVRDTSGTPAHEETTTPDGARLLIVTLKQRVINHYPLLVRLERNTSKLPAAGEAIPVLGVHPMDCVELTNEVGVHAEAGVNVSLALKNQELVSIDQGNLVSDVAVMNVPNAPAIALREIGLPADTGGLAFKHENDSPAGEPAWNLSVNVTELQPRVSNSRLATWVRIGKSRLTGRTRILYEVKDAPKGVFKVFVPDALRTTGTKIHGAGNPGKLARDIDGGQLWTIELQNKVKPDTTYTLDIDWELRRWNVDDNATPAIPALRVQGDQVDPDVQGEEGWVILTDNTGSQLEYTNREDQTASLVAKTTTHLPAWVRNAADLPDWIQSANQSARMVWSYYESGWQLALDVKELADADVDRAWITDARFTTVVAEDGQAITRMVLKVHNNALQFLKIKLPKKNDQVWQVKVQQQVRRPTYNEETAVYQVRLDKLGDLGAFEVEVIYTSRFPFPASSGQVDIQSPRFNVKLNSAHWWMYLPRDYRYTRFGGSMTPLTQQDITQRMRQLDKDGDGLLSKKELAQDFQYGELAINNPNGRAATYKDLTSHKGGKFDRDKWAAVNRYNADKLIDSIAQEQKRAIDNYSKPAGKIAIGNQLAGQAFAKLNEIRRQVDANDLELNQRIEQLEMAQKKLEVQQRELRFSNEQDAQDLRTTRNSKNPALNIVANNANQMTAEQVAFQLVQSANPARMRDVDATLQTRQVADIQAIEENIQLADALPINITLPVDGNHRIIFTQPLQAEMGEDDMTQPMTITFDAGNTRRPGWLYSGNSPAPNPIYLILWIIVALVILFLLVNLTRRLLTKPIPA